MATLRERVLGTAVAAALPVAKAVARGESKLARGVRARDGAAERLIAWNRTERDPARPVAWVHAPSVGEALMAKAIIAALRVRVPDVHVVFTCFSPSAERVLDSIGADVAGYLPWDTAGHVGRAVGALRPDVVACVRTEVWPYFARAADEAGAGIALVNAVLSDSSGRMRGPARWLLAPTYARLDAVGVVEAEDEARFRRMGVAAERIRLTGDARFDQVWQRVGTLRADTERVARMRALVPSGRPIIVAGSTWPHDERHLVNALRWLHNHGLDPICIVAPHEPTPAHLAELEARVARAGLPSMRMAQAEQRGPAEGVLLVDRVGVLADLYAIADVAYVGGGFHDEGLHSVVEPAALGVPVVFGPRLGNSREAAALARARGGQQVDGSGGLAGALRNLINDARARFGGRRRAGVRAGTAGRCGAERHAACRPPRNARASAGYRLTVTARIHLPLALRPEAGGAESIVVDCTTVADALASVAARHPTIARHIFDESGALRRHVNVFVNQAELRTLAGGATPVAAGDEIHIVPSIAGG